jgi:hypothetical protein
MDELANFGIGKTENFFDDGDDGTIGRIEADEDPRDYGLHEVRILQNKKHNSGKSFCLTSYNHTGL